MPSKPPPCRVPTPRSANPGCWGSTTETTGVAMGRDAIVSATLVLRDPRSAHDGDVIDTWIINPHRRMSPGASKVNGFTDAFLAEHGEEPIDAIERIALADRAGPEQAHPVARL